MIDITITKASKFSVYISFFFILVTMFHQPIEARGQLFGGKTQDSAKKEEFIEALSEAYDYINNNYVDELEPDILLEGALSGMMGNLGDPYSRYISIEQAESYKESITGEFGGIGISIDEGFDLDGIQYIKVVQPIEETPAYYIGIQSGDLIISVDEQSTAGMSTTDAVKIMRGEPGTRVELGIRRKRRDFSVTITRAIIKTPLFRADFIDKDTAYLQIFSFTANTPSFVEKKIKEFNKEGYTNLIVDLRGNPGGSLSAVLAVTDFFLSGGLIVGTKGRDIYKSREYNATPRVVVPKDKNVVVLVNAGSASASEIFSGAIKDTGRGVLVGETTFGKGLVQEVKDFDQGYLSLTISRYFTPNGTFIDEEGITPDILIENTNRVDEQESIEINKLYETEKLSEFIQETKGASSAKQRLRFVKELKKEDITISLDRINQIIRQRENRYNDIIEIYNLEEDEILRKTVEMLQSGTLF